MLRDKSARVEKGLRQLGIPKEATWRIRGARNCLAEISSTGAPLLPDFTLHNHTHSDNVILLLARLKDVFKFELSEHEAYLLATSAYMHDLGMFFGEGRFRREILPNRAQALPTCPENCCDRIGNYEVAGKRIGEQIREMHNLLSALMLRDDSLVRGVVDPDDLSYLMVICRGHRKADLRAQDCRCYKNEPRGGEVVRIGLLAALLRLADALDFYSDRAPNQVFEQRALDFLSNPSALEHWLKHYFVTDPYITRMDESGNITLVCTVNFRVPVQKINDESYLDFFTPLFEKHLAEVNEKDLDISQCPPVFTGALRITAMRVSPDKGKLDGFRGLPEDIIGKIEESGRKSILEFLQWLQQDTGGLEPMAQPPEQQSEVAKGNPFYLGAIEQSRIEHFYNRCSEVRNALRWLSESLSVEVTGTRRIGKTSFLRYISHPAIQQEHGMEPRRNVFVYIDCQRRLIQQEKSQIYKGMVECVVEAAGRVGVDLVAGSCEGDSAGTAFEQVLRELSHRGLRTILLLDEFEVMARNPNLDVVFFNNLRALCGADDIDVAYVTASCTDLVDLCLERRSLVGSPFFNIFRPIRLGLFSEQDSRSLVEGSLRRAEVCFPEDLVGLTLRMGGRHPFFLQMAGYYAFDLLGTGEEWTEEKRRDFEKILNKEAVRYFKFCWQKLDRQEISALMALPLSGESSSYQEEIERLGDQCLTVLINGKYDYFSPLLKEFVRYQKRVSSAQEGVTASEEREHRPDVYSFYETGLRQLLARLGQDPRYSEVHVYQQRLCENITQSRRYGDTNTRKAERAEIIDQLNSFVLSVLGISFGELCDLSTATSGEKPSERHHLP